MTALLLLFMLVPADRLAYVESSNGLIPPTMEGGRTELEFADINNDGNPDILSIGDHGSPYVNTDQHGVMVWFGDGHGNWSVFQYGDFGYGGIAVGDVNGDGLWDVGYGMHHNYSSNDLGDQLMEVALGDGTGRMWTPWDDSLAQEGQNWGMFSTDFADIDNDGDLDAGSISFGADDGLWVYCNLANGAWRNTFGFPGGNSNMEFYFRDVNRDGNADIIAAHGSGSIWFGDGAGGFTAADNGLPASSRGLKGLSVGDVDNDGGCDVAFANTQGGLEVWTWDDGAEVWQSFSGSLPTTDSFSATQLCDMDADGNLDLCALASTNLRIWLGDGAGNWTQDARIPMNGRVGYSALRVGADFDHNGRPDIACVTREGSWPSDHNVMHAYREASPVESLGIFPVFPRGGEKFRNGSVQFVDWWSEAPDADSTRVKLEFSAQGAGGPWQLVAGSLRNGGRFQWTVPTGVISPDCYIRYTVTGSSGMSTATTPRPFAVGDTSVGLVSGSHGRRVSRLRLVPGVVGRNRVIRVFHEPAQAGQLTVIDAAGRLIREQPVEPGQAGQVLSCSGLAAGVYLIRLGNAGARFVLAE